MKKLNICYVDPISSNKFTYYENIKESIKKKSRKFTSLHSIEQLNEKLTNPNFKPDFILLGYGITNLGNNPLQEISKTNIPKGIFLNKEYSRLDEKLNWIKNNNFSLAFTVLEKEDEFSEISKTLFKRVNFAVNPNLFLSRKNEYRYDISFSGVIREEQDSNIRLKVMEELFLDPYWYSQRIIFSSHLNDSIKDYRNRIAFSKMTLSSTGPADIVGTRYFEVMASNRSVLLCNYKEGIYDNLFENYKDVLMFEHPSEIKNLYETYIENEENRKTLLANARENILKNHTWEHRAEQVIGYINEL